MPAILETQDLTTNYRTASGWVRAAEGVNLRVEKGEALGIAGESGCGKTTVALSILKILPQGGVIRGGKILFDGMDLVPLSENEMRKIRWKGIAIVFQGAMNAMNPVIKVGDQIVEAIRTHEPDTDNKSAWERARKLFELVGIDPERVDNYRHGSRG